MRSSRIVFAWALLALVATSSPDAVAYIGPGAGVGLIATVLGVLAALVLAVLGIVYYPAKRFFNKLKARRAHEDDGNDSGG